MHSLDQNVVTFDTLKHGRGLECSVSSMNYSLTEYLPSNFKLMIFKSCHIYIMIIILKIEFISYINIYTEEKLYVFKK